MTEPQPTQPTPARGRRGQPRPVDSALTALIRAGRSGKLSQPDFARAFADTRVLLLSGTEPTADEAEPLVLELPSGGPGVAVFGSPDEVAPEYLEAASHPLPLTGRELLEMLPPGVGLALNPGRPMSLVLEPSEMQLFGFVALSPAQENAPGGKPSDAPSQTR